MSEVKRVEVYQSVTSDNKIVLAVVIVYERPDTAQLVIDENNVMPVTTYSDTQKLLYSLLMDTKRIRR